MISHKGLQWIKEKRDIYRIMRNRNEVKSDDCYVVAPFMVNMGNTCAESDTDSFVRNGNPKVLKKIKKKAINKVDGNATDSSVEIVDVTLPYEKLVEEKRNIPTQELDTLDLWDRLG